MGTFGRAILVGSAGTSEADGAVVLGKGGKDFGTVAKFAALIHDEDVLVGNIGCISSEPAVEPFYGGLLGSTSGALDLATVVVGDGDVAGFTVEASVFFKMLGVLGGLDNEAEFNTESLKAGSGFAGVVFAFSRFTDLCSTQQCRWRNC
jgi:hypothetical protein